VHACSGKGVQHLLQGNERAENTACSVSNLWAGQESTRPTLFNLYLAWVKASQFFAFKALGMVVTGN